MAVRKVVTFPADILEQECERVEIFDKKLGKLLDDMYDTMIEYDGVGLAAPQIGIDRRIAVVDVDGETFEFVNPEIIEASGSQTGPEGCLSIPGLFGEVTRPDKIKVRAQNRKGKWFEMKASGFLSRAIQHEIDHLHGVLFTTKVDRYLDDEELEEGNGE